MVVGLGTAFVVGWLGSGQELVHLGPFLVNGLRIVVAYNGALGWESLELPRNGALIMAPVVSAHDPPVRGAGVWERRAASDRAAEFVVGVAVVLEFCRVEVWMRAGRARKTSRGAS